MVEINELVIAKIIEITNYGITVNLLDYNKNAFVHLNELSTIKYKRLNGIVKLGNVEVMRIMKIDKECIDVSRKHISENEKENVFNYHIKRKKINNIVKFSTFDENIKKEYIKLLIEKGFSLKDIPDTEIHSFVCNKYIPITTTYYKQKAKLNVSNTNDINYIKVFIAMLEKEYEVIITIINLKKQEIQTIRELKEN